MRDQRQPMCGPHHAWMEGSRDVYVIVQVASLPAPELGPFASLFAPLQKGLSTALP